MENFWNNIAVFLYTVKNTMVSVFSGIRFFDIVDIIILTFVVYKVIEFCRDTRAKTLLKGIFLIIIMYALSSWLEMTGVNWVLDKVLTYGLVILAIVFQPELRRGLERVGHSSFGFFGKGNLGVNQEVVDCINQVCKAVHSMSDQKIGALIVFENETPLGEIINTGTIIDAEASASMVGSVFFPNSPLHDGAMIIRGGRLYAAGCILPLTSKQDISQDLGTRHRAAIGISENSDAITVIVSEETGTISLTRNGEISRGYNSQSLQQELYSIFVDTTSDAGNPLSSFLNFFKKRDKGEMRK